MGIVIWEFVKQSLLGIWVVVHLHFYYGLFFTNVSYNEWLWIYYTLTNYGYIAGKCPKVAWQTLWREQPPWKDFQIRTCSRPLVHNSCAIGYVYSFSHLGYLSYLPHMESICVHVSTCMHNYPFTLMVVSLSFVSWFIFCSNKNAKDDSCSRPSCMVWSFTCKCWFGDVLQV